MRKPNGRTYSIQKQWFNGQPTSLLSVRKWTQLLYFYAWDLSSHRLELEKGSEFIREKLRPMRVVFADEVEMTGYSPVPPEIKAHTVVGIDRATSRIGQAAVRAQHFMVEREAKRPHHHLPVNYTPNPTQEG